MVLPIFQSAGGDTARQSTMTSRVEQAGNPLRGVAQLLAQGQLAKREADDRADRIKSVRAKATYERQVRDVVDGLDPLAPDYDDQLTTALTGLRDTVVQNARFANPQYAEMVTAELDGFAQGFGGQASIRRRDILVAEGARQLELSAGEFLAQVQADPDNHDAQMAAFLDDARPLIETLPPEQQGAFADTLTRQTLEARVQGLAMSGRYDDAVVLIDEEAGLLGAERVRALKTSARNTRDMLRNERLLETQRTVSQFALTLDSALSLEEIDRAQVDLAAMDAQGMFDGREGQLTQYQRGINERRTELVKRAREMDEILYRFESGLGVRTAKEADAAWKAYQAERIPAADRQDMNATIRHMARFSAQAGRAPTDVMDFMAQASTSSDPSYIGAAGQLYGALRTAAPLLSLGDVGETVQAADALIRFAGLDPARAGELVLEQAANPKLRQTRADALRGENAPLAKDRETIRTTIAEITPPVGGSWFERASNALSFGAVGDVDRARIPEEAIDVYAQAAESMYLVTGDADLARTVAKAQVQTQFGWSKLTGYDTEGRPREELTRFPPERVLSMQSFRAGEQIALTEQQSERILRARLENTMQARFPDIPLDRVTLQPSPTMQTDLAAGRPGEYIVRVQDERLPGLTRPLVVDGEVVVFRLPTMEQLLDDPEYVALEASARRGGEWVPPRDWSTRTLDSLLGAAGADREIMLDPDAYEQGHRAGLGVLMGD